MAPLFTGSRFGFGLGPLVAAAAPFTPDTGTYLNYGWYGGGAPRITSVSRIDWSSDLSTASPRSGIDADATYGGGLSSLSYGWFSGGYNPAFDPSGGRSTVSRIDYANDLSGSSNRASTPNSSNSRSGGFSNTTYGYWGTGMTGNGGGASSAVTRVDFANDLTSPANRTNTYSPYINHTGGASDFSTYGWFAGGQFGGAGGVTGNPISTIYRLTYASDTSALSTRGNLSGESTGQASGNKTYFWVAGKDSPAVSSNIERVTFSSDLATATTRGTLTTARRPSGSGNNTYIWWAAGYNGSAQTSIVDRMSYETDLAASSPRGNLHYSNQVYATNHMTLG